MSITDDSPEVDGDLQFAIDLAELEYLADRVLAVAPAGPVVGEGEFLEWWRRYDVLKPAADGALTLDTADVPGPVVRTNVGRRMNAAEVMALHSICQCGDGSEDAVENAQHQLDALKAAGYEVFRVAAECANCGERIKWEPDFKLWFHKVSGIEHCYRAPEHTETARPKPATSEARS